MNAVLAESAGTNIAPNNLRGAVTALQTELGKLPQVPLLTEHTFHGGIYCRQVFFHAGTMAVGLVHKKEHYFMVVSGTLHVTTDEGATTLVGPFLLCSNPGTKRAVFAETDVLCFTLHRVDENARTVNEIADDLMEIDPASHFELDNTLKSPLIEVLV